MVETTDVSTFLKRADARDRERGGAGFRNSRDVADQFSISTDQARRLLRKLCVEGLADEYEGGEYRITAAGIAATEER